MEDNIETKLEKVKPLVHKLIETIQEYYGLDTTETISLELTTEMLAALKFAQLTIEETLRRSGIQVKKTEFGN